MRVIRYFIICFLFVFIFSNFYIEAQGAVISRIWGADRYLTAAAVSQRGWMRSEYVILARGDDFADAMCAVPLAAKYDAPLLLTEPDGLNVHTLDEIVRLKASHVIITGGPGAISPSVDDELKLSGVKAVERIYGIDRFETALRIGERLGKVNAVAIAPGYDYPDALSISSIAGFLDIPILLAGPDGLNEDELHYISDRDILTTYIVGGRGVIGSGVEATVPNPIRLGGIDRYETNMIIINEFQDILSFDNIYIASGDGFADALSGSALASKFRSPIILVSEAVPDVIQSLIKLKLMSDINICILGGKGAVSDEIISYLHDNEVNVPSAETEISAQNIISVHAVNGTTMEVKFDRIPDSVSKVDFNFTGGLDVTSVHLKQNDSTVVLLTTGIQDTKSQYRLYYKGIDTGISTDGAALLRLSLSDKSWHGRQGEMVEINFDCELEDGVSEANNTCYVLEWTRDGQPAGCDDLTIKYDDLVLTQESGKYRIFDPNTINGYVSHTVYVVFNTEGTFALRIFAEYDDV